MNKLGGYLAVSIGFGMATGIASQNIPVGIFYGMAGGLMLLLILKRLSKR
jgi:hypothetical protein